MRHALFSRQRPLPARCNRLPANARRRCALRLRVSATRLPCPQTPPPRSTTPGRLLEIGILFSLCERYELHLPALAVLAVAAPYQPYSDKVEFVSARCARASPLHRRATPRVACGLQPRVARRGLMPRRVACDPPPCPPQHLDQLLQRALAGGWAAACDIVRELRAHFCAPSGAEAYVFRLDQICGTLERERASAPDASPSAVVELLSQGVEPRVPWEALWRAYANAHTRGSRMQAMWEESSALRIHLFGEHRGALFVWACVARCALALASLPSLLRAALATRCCLLR